MQHSTNKRIKDSVDKKSKYYFSLICSLLKRLYNEEEYSSHPKYPGLPQFWRKIVNTQGQNDK